MSEPEFQELTVVQGSALEAITRAEVDVNISTAKKYPRSLAVSKTRLAALACLDQRTAQECIFSVPRDGKLIHGPSVRFAEMLASTWGNIIAGARIVDIGPTSVTAQGRCHDLETNNCLVVEVTRSILGKGGKRFSESMIATTCNAATSIARRNAILACVPKALWVECYERAAKTSLGEAGSFTAHRDQTLKALTEKHKCRIDDILLALGIRGVADVGPDELITLKAALNGIESGAIKASEAFARPAPADPEPAKADEPKPASKTEEAKKSL